MGPVTVYAYAGCSGCRSTLAALREAGVETRVVALDATPPDAATLRDLWQRSGVSIRKMFNTSGRSYRDGGFGARVAAMSDDEALAALAADGMLVKRPIVDFGDRVTVGHPALVAALAAG
ncbi:MAG: arsenate reductase family protein [Myxococcales bacterium]|nr:arsenate reductase family protein [Myxococcales bacterium]MCB9531885.1 arsenate reductase family protein [Myxococcales bacterium]MCB9533997.1 arsenate reductase family protein [Myxococcales bacterium]